MASSKSHKGMSDAVWLARLKSFAQTGVWPSREGNRPSPRQKRWHELYQKIENCPLQMRGQTTLVKEAQTCICGLHKVHPPVTVHESQSTPAQSTPSISDASHAAKRAKLTLSLFERSRFGGSHVAGAKPNLSTQRKTSQIEHSSSAEASCSPSDPRRPPPPRSPKHYRPVIQPSSPFFIPPAQRSQRIIETATSLIISEFAAVRSPVSPQPEDPSDLPLLWPQTMPQQDQKWVSEAIFRVGSKGKLELRENLQLWYHPPPPALLYHQAPTPDRFFSQSLLLWMPYRLWKVRLQCTNSACARHQLCGGGLHRRQLDLAHRSEFRVILTRKYACDIRVLRLLRERGMGKGPVRIIGQLRENHSEEWLKRVARCTSECVAFLNNPGLHPLHFQEPPPLIPVPSYKWLLTVYSQDILNRLDHIKASITYTYGSILKMDSTKKITKKLSGPAKGTAQWLTSVGNEIGQVRAGVDPPAILYVDCDCCKEVGETKLKRQFSRWPNVIVCLDIWHFMRRLAVGCTTDAHQLYPTFMARLSSCIFEWDAEDITLLRRAKRAQLTQQGWPAMTDRELDHHISKDELILNCRRRTQGEETTTRLLDMLISELMGGKGNDALGVPLLDSVRMQHIWRVQRRHVTCIQDPPNVPLYTETGTINKGNSANSLNFQIYLMEGLLRWNQDRAAAAVAGGGSNLRTYTGELVYSVNENYNKLYGRKLVSSFTPPAIYTGELIGVQYLLRQNSQPLEDMCPTSDRTSHLLEEIDVEEQLEEDEGFIDFFGEEATVTNLVASDEPIHLPSAMLHPPVASVQVPSTAPLPYVQTPSATPLPTAMLPPVASVQVPSAAPLPYVQTLSATPLPTAMVVDEHCIPGMGRVDELAECLVALRTQASLTLTNQQVATIVGLWQKLDQFDKDRVTYAARHQDRLLTGRFRSPKKKAVFTPGVDSTKRCVLGSSGSPAQWPNCCRLVVMIFIRLCNIHRSPKKQRTESLSRWDLILRDYRKIRQLILSNGTVMSETTLQLVEVNQRTLTTWHNTRLKGQEVSVLLQGLELPEARPVALDALPPARLQPVVPLQYSHQLHNYCDCERAGTRLENAGIDPATSRLRLLHPTD
ncbi:hypothetical protein QQF64_003467 [Cirrhinus molitorella]|uniref:DUF6729 domain-containing protein n=1 Tax=Cirrhinus molitorella TaxID=172907 RepID=A0ABR3MLE3_9TELE